MVNNGDLKGIPASLSLKSSAKWDKILAKVDSSELLFIYCGVRHILKVKAQSSSQFLFHFHVLRREFILSWGYCSVSSGPLFSASQSVKLWLSFFGRYLSGNTASICLSRAKLSPDTLSPPPQTKRHRWSRCPISRTSVSPSLLHLLVYHFPGPEQVFGPQSESKSDPFHL